MATTSPSIRSLRLFLFMIFGIILFTFTIPTSATQSQEAPSPDTDIICHTDDPKDCYPRVFQPTDEFQIVHDDQEIPKGLHVRLNIGTGLREAKINVPDEQNPALEGLPVDQAVVIVDPEQPEAPRIPKGAPVYEPVGKIKEPEHEAHGFAHAIKMLKSGNAKDDAGFDDALEGMEDISHDIYYGLKITEDPDILKGLFCLMADGSVPVTEGVTPRDQQAAAILASALQNNPPALKEVTKKWTDLMSYQCPETGLRIDEVLYTSLVPSTQDLDQKSSTRLASKAKAKVAVINGLIKDDGIRAEFMRKGGMQRLLEVLVPEGKEWTGAQRKVGQLILDNYLDEDMGAKPGQWPTTARLEDSQCQEPGSTTQEGCWDYHVERIMKANKANGGHWSKDANDRLKALRKAERNAPIHKDL